MQVRLDRPAGAVASAKESVHASHAGQFGGKMPRVIDGQAAGISVQQLMMPNRPPQRLLPRSAQPVRSPRHRRPATAARNGHPRPDSGGRWCAGSSEIQHAQRFGKSGAESVPAEVNQGGHIIASAGQTVADAAGSHLSQLVCAAITHTQFCSQLKGGAHDSLCA